METVRQLVRDYKIKTNKLPFKTIILATGVICHHYKNGSIKVER